MMIVLVKESIASKMSLEPGGMRRTLLLKETGALASSKRKGEY